MELHPAIGARILSGSTNELLMMAEQIALTHHERWDGRGYPNGLAARGDPAARPHRRRRRRVRRAHAPAPVQGARGRSTTAVREVLGEAGTRFDPAVTEAFARLDHRLLVHQPRTGPVAVEDTLAGAAAERSAPTPARQPPRAGGRARGSPGRRGSRCAWRRRARPAQRCVRPSPRCARRSSSSVAVSCAQATWNPLSRSRARERRGADERAVLGVEHRRPGIRPRHADVALEAGPARDLVTEHRDHERIGASRDEHARAGSGRRPSGRRARGRAAGRAPPRGGVACTSQASPATPKSARAASSSGSPGSPAPP